MKIATLLISSLMIATAHADNTGSPTESQYSRHITFVVAPNGWVNHCSIKSDGDGNISLLDCEYSPETKIMMEESLGNCVK